MWHRPPEPAIVSMTVGVSHEKVSQVVFLLVRWPSCACRHSSIRTHREAIVARCSVPGGESSLHLCLSTCGSIIPMEVGPVD